MSIVISWGLMALLEIVDTTSVRSVVDLDHLGALTGDSGWATDGAIAALAAALTAAAPWLSRRARRIGWAVALAMSVGPPPGVGPFLRLHPCPRVRVDRRSVDPRDPRGTLAAPDRPGDRRRAFGRRRAARGAEAGERRRPRLDALLREDDRRQAALRQGSGRGPAQRRPPLPPLPNDRPPRPRRRASVLDAAEGRRARGDGGVRRAATSGSAHRGCRVRVRRAELVRARLRGRRGQVARSASSRQR